MRAQELEVLARRPTLGGFVNHSLYRARFSPCPCSPWHHFARILQTKADPAPSHSGSGRHNCAVGAARIYLTRRSARPSRLCHTGGGRRHDPLCCDFGGPPLLVPAEARQAAYAAADGVGPLTRERRKNLFLNTRSAQSRNKPFHDPSKF